MMKKKIALVTLALLVLSNVALAKFSDEFKAQYPTKYKITQEQDASGKINTIEEYKLFNGNGLALSVKSLNGEKHCGMFFQYFGNSWKFYDKLLWGDGNNVHEFVLIGKPARNVVSGGKVIEVLAFRVVPSEVKNAIAISTHSEREGTKVILSSTPLKTGNDYTDKMNASLWTKWVKAINDAEKLMAEN